MKKTDSTKFGDGCGAIRTLRADGNIRWYNSFAKLFGSVCKC